MQQGNLPPEVQKAIEQGKQRIAQLEQENAQLKLSQQAEMQKIQMQGALKERELQVETDLEIMKINKTAEVDAYKARLNAQAIASRPAPKSGAN